MSHAQGTLLSLPIELQLQIFQNLHIQDLHTLSQTCHTLHNLINNDELWKRLFQKKYQTTRFSSFSRSHKFAIELLKRDDNLKVWKRGMSVNRNSPVQVSGVHDIQLNYPRLTMLTDQGTIKALSLDKFKSKTKIEYEVPVTSMNGCTSFQLGEKYGIFGRFDGRLFLKALGPSKTAFVTSVVKFDKDHQSAVTCVYCDELNGVVYSGDENGALWMWDVKTKQVLKEFDLAEAQQGNQLAGLKFVKGFGKLIFVIDANNMAFLIDAINNEQIQIDRLDLEQNFETYDFDFPSLTLTATDIHGLRLFQFHKHSFGQHFEFSVKSESNSVALDDSIHSIAIEKQRPSRQQNIRLAGQDGRHLAICLKSGIVLTFNLRSPETQNGQLQALAVFLPDFDSLKIPDGVSPISGIDVNSSVVLVSTFNGFAEVYDVLTGDFIRVISSRIPKKYLPLTEAPFIIPTGVAILGEERLGCFGVTMTNDIVQYFQCGELRHRLTAGMHGSSSGKANVVGAVNDMRRNKKYHKVIKNGIADLQFENHQDDLKERLVSKYNGDSQDIADEAEELELAMVLNQSLNGDIGAADDEELQMALALSKLEFEQPFDDSVENPDELQESSNGTGEDVLPVPDDEDAEFQRQIEEAMRLSLAE